MTHFSTYPEDWATTVNQLRKKLVAPVLLTLHVLEDFDWDVEGAESYLRTAHGYGGYS